MYYISSDIFFDTICCIERPSLLPLMSCVCLCLLCVKGVCLTASYNHLFALLCVSVWMINNNRRIEKFPLFSFPFNSNAERKEIVNLFAVNRWVISWTYTFLLGLQINKQKSTGISVI